MPAEIELPGLLSYSLSAEQLLDGIRVVRDFSLHVRRVGLPDYAAFRNALRDIDQIETRVVRVMPGNVD
jgi:glycerol-3-phosphate responsive antiterminator